MKLIQTPSLIAGVILGASLITLSAASNDSVLGGLHVFVPGTTVSSADVNDNFTMVVDEVSALEGRVDNLENVSVGAETIYFEQSYIGYYGDSSNLKITVPAGYGYKIKNGWFYDATGNNLDNFGSNANLFCKVENFIFGGVDPDIENAASTWAHRDFLFPPGVDLIFYNNNVGRNFSELRVEIEKIAYSPITQN